VNHNPPDLCLPDNWDYIGQERFFFNYFSQVKTTSYSRNIEPSLTTDFNTGKAGPMSKENKHNTMFQPNLKFNTVPMADLQNPQRSKDSEVHGV
jgi:hypothetical protein